MTDPTAPTTPAGKALVEWAKNADPKQVDLWREHAALIEAEARSTSAEALDTPHVCTVCGNLHTARFDESGQNPARLRSPESDRRAEAAEEDWQATEQQLLAAERRIVLLEAVVREARGHIDHLVEYTEPSWRAFSVKSWAEELPRRLSTSGAHDGPVQSAGGTS